MGRPRSGAVPRNQVKVLNERHREMARRLLLGEKQCDIARDMGITPPRVSDIARSPVFIEYLDGLTKKRDREAIDLAQDVKRGACSGLEVLLKILTPGTEESRQADLRTKAQVAQDLLDREGSAPRISRNWPGTKGFGSCLTTEDIEELKIRAAERA